MNEQQPSSDFTRRFNPHKSTNPNSPFYPIYPINVNLFQSIKIYKPKLPFLSHVTPTTTQALTAPLTRRQTGQHWRPIIPWIDCGQTDFIKLHRNIEHTCTTMHHNMKPFQINPKLLKLIVPPPSITCGKNHVVGIERIATILVMSSPRSFQKSLVPYSVHPTHLAVLKLKNFPITLFFFYCLHQIDNRHICLIA